MPQNKNRKLLFILFSNEWMRGEIMKLRGDHPAAAGAGVAEPGSCCSLPKDHSYLIITSQGFIKIIYLWTVPVSHGVASLLLTINQKVNNLLKRLKRRVFVRRGQSAGAAAAEVTPVFVCFMIPTVHYVSFFIRSAYYFFTNYILVLST